MVIEDKNKAEYLIVDTSAFIKNVNLQDIGQNVITIQEVLEEIKSKRQIRRLVVLPYDLQVKDVFSENVKYVTEFSKKTGDYPSLSATDLKVIALTYQLEKELVGTEHLRAMPEINRTVDYCNYSAIPADDIAGFYNPKKHKKTSESEEKIGNQNDHIGENENKLSEDLENININEKNELFGSGNFKELENDDINLDCNSTVNKLEDSVTQMGTHQIITTNDGVSNNDDDEEHFICTKNLLVRVESEEDDVEEEEEEEEEEVEDNGGSDDCDEEDGDGDWITVSNVKQAKEQMDAENLEDKPVQVACLTTDFAMQNVMKQMGLNIVSLDGRVIKQLRTFILRCYACFKTTSVMTKVFCPHCGNKTLKKVAVSLDSEGKQVIHINLRRPLTARGKKFSLPKPRGGKHADYPILSEDQPVPDQRPTRLAKMKNNPLESDYIAGFSPFVMRDVNSKSAMLGIPNKAKEIKYWMRRNPNEPHRNRKK